MKLLFILAAVAQGFSVQAAPAKLIKVLPQFLDLEGRHAVSPSLFDRDAYQARLRQRPQDRSGIQFAIQWKAPNSMPLKLRVELRGARGAEPTTAVLEAAVEHHGLFSNWSIPKLLGEDYKKFGELAAWRVTLWNTRQQVAEQKSFLW